MKVQPLDWPRLLGPKPLFMFASYQTANPHSRACSLCLPPAMWQSFMGTHHLVPLSSPLVTFPDINCVVFRVWRESVWANFCARLHLSCF